jgi:Ankyrin repeats (many copies)/Ankyrin repeat
VFRIDPPSHQQPTQAGEVACLVAITQDLSGLLVAIAAGDSALVRASLDAAPALATGRLARRDEFFITHCHAQVYEGATALHAAAFTYDRETARDLVARGADIRARDRRGAEPLHAAVIGEPGTPNWNPARQRAVIEYLVAAGADLDAAALGGVTPLHRAVRNRCSAAVDALLRAGADPRAANDHGSTPSDLAHRATGRGGAGSVAAKTEQQIIIDLLKKATG